MSNPYLLVFADEVLAPRLASQPDVVSIDAGSIANVYLIADGMPAGYALPKFVTVELTDAVLSDVEHYAERWCRQSQTDVIAHDEATDTYRLKLWAVNAGGDGRGAVEFDAVESLIAGWNASVVSVADNEIIFDVAVYDAIKSREFWDNAASLAVLFSEQSYDMQSGDHIIQADYTALGKSASTVDKMARAKSARIISHNNHLITVSIHRDAVIAQMKSELSAACDVDVLRYRYAVDPALLSAAIAAGGRLQVPLSSITVIDKSA